MICVSLRHGSVERGRRGQRSQVGGQARMEMRMHMRLPTQTRMPMEKWNAEMERDSVAIVVGELAGQWIDKLASRLGGSTMLRDDWGVGKLAERERAVHDA